MDTIFVHLSSSSLDWKKARIFEVAGIRIADNGEREGSTFDRINQDAEFETTSQLLEFGFSVKAWQDAIPLSSALSTLSRTLVDGRIGKYVVVAHGAARQQSLLMSECERLNLVNPFEGRAWICTEQLAWPMAVAGLVTARRLSVVCQYWNLDLPDTPNAADTVNALAELYRSMMKRYTLLLSAEQTARDMTGGLFGQLGKVLGL